MEVGRYRFTRWNNGKWQIQWQDDQRTNHSMTIDNLEAVFDLLVKPHNEHVKQLADYFNMACRNSDKFFDMAFAEKLVSCLPHEDSNLSPPGFRLNSLDLFQYHLQSFITGYYNMTGKLLTMAEMESALVETKQAWMSKYQ